MLHPERHYLCLIIIIAASLFSNSINMVQPEHPILSILMLYLYNTLGLDAREKWRVRSDTLAVKSFQWCYYTAPCLYKRRKNGFCADVLVVSPGGSPGVLSFIDFHPHLDLSSHSLMSLGMLLVYVFRVYDVSSRYI